MLYSSGYVHVPCEVQVPDHPTQTISCRRPPHHTATCNKNIAACMYLLHAPTHIVWRCASTQRVSMTELLQQADQIFRMLFLYCENLFEQPARSRIDLVEVFIHLAIADYRDPFGDKIFLDHLDQTLTLHDFGLTARQHAIRCKIGLAAKLHDARGDAVCVSLLLIRMLEEFSSHVLRVEAGGRGGGPRGT